MAGPGLRQRDSVVTVSSQKSPLLSARDSCSGGSGVGGQARPAPTVGSLSESPGPRGSVPATPPGSRGC